MICNKCGQETPDGAKFCIKCGTKMDSKPNGQSVSKKKVSKEESDKKTPKMIYVIVGISIVLFVLSGVMIWYAMRGNHEKSKQSAKQDSSRVLSNQNESVEEGTEPIDVSSFQAQLDQWKTQFAAHTLSGEIQETYNKTVSDYETAIAKQDVDICGQCENNMKSLFEKMEQEEYNIVARRNAYAGVLTGVSLGVLPNDEYCTAEEYDSEEALNEYAITDIDGDGKEELILSILNGSMAEMAEWVYEYNVENNSLEQELVVFPGSIFYSNGAVMGIASHNQTYGVDLWPYSAYQYNAETDQYEDIGYVESWEREYGPDDFPSEADKDNDGIVYLYGLDATEYKDKAEYDTWYESVFGGATEIEISWKYIMDKEYTSYTDDFIADVKEKVNAKLQPGQMDMGICYIENNDDFLQVEKMLASSVSAQFTEKEDGLVREGSVNETEFYFDSGEDAGYIVYENNKIDNVTLLGVYPGMSETEARSLLLEYGFYAVDYMDNVFITGTAFGNYMVDIFTDDNGNVERIGMYPHCGFVG